MIRTTILLTLFVSLFFACTNNVSDSGGASETVATIKITGNKINGQISGDTYDTSIIVKIFDTEFIPIDSDVTLKDSSKEINISSLYYGDTILCDNTGSFNTTIPTKGFYNILIYNGERSLGLFDLNIQDSSYTIYKTLNKSQEIYGTINSISNDSISNYHIVILGTDIYDSTVQGEVFILNNIPLGNHKIFYTHLNTESDWVNVSILPDSSNTQDIEIIESKSSDSITIITP